MSTVVEPVTAIGHRPGAGVATPGAFAALYRLVLRHQVNRGRAALLLVVAALGVGLGALLTRVESDDQVQAATDTVSGFGLGLVVPVVALVMGSAVFGAWLEDETLVYVWLRPVRRWIIAVAGFLAAITVVLPATVVPLTAMAAIGSGGDSGVILGAAAGTALAATAYTSMFVAIGLLVKRALLWGLVYVFIWEFFVSRAGAGAARLSINSYASSVLARLSDVDIRLADRAVWSSYTIPLVVTVVAVAFTTWRLHRASVA